MALIDRAIGHTINSDGVPEEGGADGGDGAGADMACLRRAPGGRLAAGRELATETLSAGDGMTIVVAGGGAAGAGAGAGVWEVRLACCSQMWLCLAFFCSLVNRPNC